MIWNTPFRIKDFSKNYVEQGLKKFTKIGLEVDLECGIRDVG